MIKLKNISFSYGNGHGEGGIKNINMHIKPGEVLLLCGESGCGKTTLTRLINGLIPNFHEGVLKGDVEIGGKRINEKPLYETAKCTGSVFQNPRSQFFNLDTASEITFGCENQGLPEEIILSRLEETLEVFQIEKLRERSLFQLSGGEKQKIACAASSASNPDIFVLDEPSSNLDVKGTNDMAAAIARWKNEGKTVVIAEHRLYYLKNLADRILYMKKGEICGEYTMDDLEGMGQEKLAKMGLRPLSMEQLFIPEVKEKEKEKTITMSNFSHKYKKTGNGIAIDSLEVEVGSSTAIVGHNGAGKTTFARILTGLAKKSKGCLKGENFSTTKAKERLEKTYMVMQDVNHQLFTESVLDEVLLSMEKEDEEKACDILSSLGLLHLKEAHPMSLSGGEKQRVAIAGAIASNREIIIFDEPTSGLDLRHMKEVAWLIKELQEKGKTIFVISHDLELISLACDTVVQMEEGKVKEAYKLKEDTWSRLFSWFSKEN